MIPPRSTQDTDANGDLRTSVDTRAVGLEIGLDFIRLATGREHLHYGLWQPDQQIALANLFAAQEAYTDKLLEMLPDQSDLAILDIGGGAGETARRLLKLGHSVDVIVPSDTLMERCRVNLSDRARLYHSTFEDFRAERTYDVCLFSESFQYVRLEVGLRKAKSLLKPGGIILIADCFRNDAYTTPRPVGGGIPLERFYDEMERNALTATTTHDITASVAPSVDLERQVYHFLHNTLLRTSSSLKSTHPKSHKLIHILLNRILGSRRKKKLNDRLLGHNRTSTDFIKHNTYLFLAITLS
ncbi:MAG: class I SAM-dependent methyltransferase [Rhodobacteraceae bacterium]|nr:class I SAM-dependent methyltransferase [Paracoccaceae bacterium]